MDYFRTLSILVLIISPPLSFPNCPSPQVSLPSCNPPPSPSLLIALDGWPKEPNLLQLQGPFVSLVHQTHPLFPCCHCLKVSCCVSHLRSDIHSCSPSLWWYSEPSAALWCHSSQEPLGTNTGSKSSTQHSTGHLKRKQLNGLKVANNTN